MNTQELLAAYADGQRRFRYADFTGADLSRADLRGADLTDANLFNADLRGADLTDANLFNAKL